MSYPKKTQSRATPSIGRRDFLSLGCAGAVSLPFMGTAFSSDVDLQHPSTDDAVETGLYGLSVGFIHAPETRINPDAPSPLTFQGSDTHPSQEELSISNSILDPSQFLRGESEFLSRDARLTVHGGFGLPTLLSHTPIEELLVEVDYAPYQPVRFTAWHYGNHEVVNEGSRNSFVVPVSRKLGLNLYTQLKGEGQLFKFRSQFLTGSLPGSMKLKRGFYLLTLIPYGTERPRNGNALRQYMGPSILISIDYAHREPGDLQGNESFEEVLA